MNSKGQIIITDLLLYIIVITIILGTLLYTTYIINDNQVTRINNKEMEKTLEDTLTILTKTSGTPTNWEYINEGDIKTIGLKSKNGNQLSYDKLIKLKNNNQLLDKYFPNGTDYSLSLYSKNNPNDKEIISGSKNFYYKKQISSKNVYVIFDYGYEVFSFNEVYKNEICPYNHDDNWVCRTLTINKTILDEGKYYIITNSENDYVLSNTYLDSISGHCSNKLNINKQLEQLLYEDNQTIYLHIKTKNNDTCLVYDSKNREKYLNSVIKPELYILNLKIAK